MGDPQLVQIAYEATAYGILPAALETIMDAVPIPLVELAEIGVSFRSETTTVVGQLVTRFIDLDLIEATSATATAAIGAGQTSGPIAHLTVTGRGAGFVRPPVVVFGESSGTPPTKQAIANAGLQVESVHVDSGGSGYIDAEIAFVGGDLLPGGVPAQAHATIVGHAITAITVDVRGGPYRRVPKIVITSKNTVTTVAKATASMSIGAVNLVNPGDGYTSPTVQIVGFFKFVWPHPASDERQPFYDLMTNAIKQATGGNVIAAVPALG